MKMTMNDLSKIDLSTCQRGDRVRLRDGTKGKYLYREYNGYCIMAGKLGNGWYCKDGTFLGFPSPDPWDVVAILGPSIIERVRRWFKSLERKGEAK